jgi:hypothetical protein
MMPAICTPIIQFCSTSNTDYYNSSSRTRQSEELILQSVLQYRHFPATSRTQRAYSAEQRYQYWPQGGSMCISGWAGHHGNRSLHWACPILQFHGRFTSITNCALPPSQTWSRLRSTVCSPSLKRATCVTISEDGHKASRVSGLSPSL